MVADDTQVSVRMHDTHHHMTGSVFVPGQNTLQGQKMKELLTAIMLWITANFDLPAVDHHPGIEFAAPGTLAELRPGGSAIDEVVAIYLDGTGTIYLPRDWEGGTAADLSVLVHEMVHHLQNGAGTRYACPQEREKLAFEVQERWLGMFGTSLIDEFGIDKMTLLLRTKCGF